MSASSLFRARFRRSPRVVCSAPGRVNLIGEHTDYNEGLVLPFAIDARAHIAAALLDHPVARVVSAQRPGGIVEAPLALLRPGSAATAGWPAYAFGAIWALLEPLADAGLELPGIELALDSQVPAGAGLSSSAAVECATALAVSELTGLPLPPAELARLCQRAENEFVGVPTGLMDQMASATCRAGHLLFFDVGENHTEPVPFDPAADGRQAVVIDTRAHHALADGEYARRHAECARAAEVLGVPSLRRVDDLAAAESVLVGRPDGDVLLARTRHVVTENARVRQVVAALRAGVVDWPVVGAALTASHVSLRDDYQVSSAELDLAADTALAAGALGARMVGGGFGGSVLALVPEASVDAVRSAVGAAFAAAGFPSPVLRQVAPADGARRDR